MTPPPVEELMCHNKSFIRTETVNPVSTEIFRQFSSGERRFAGDHTAHDCCENLAPDSTSKDSNAKTMKTLPVSSDFVTRSK